MKNIWIITLFTLREAMARKVFMFFAAISALVLSGLLLFVIFIGTDSLTSMLIQGADKIVLREIVTGFELLIVNPLASLGLLLAIFSSASFVPNMLEKGNIDLLLSKPVSRTQLLLGKYFGGLLVVFLNILFLVIGVWLIISIKFSYWDFSFLTVSLTVTFTFAVLYAVIVFFGVLTKSSIPGMMAAYLIFLVISPVLYFYHQDLRAVIQYKFLRMFLDFFYYIIPKTSELMGEITIKIAMGKSITSFQPVLTSLLFLIFILGITILIFRKKDF
jgi:ABC-type transport system involved in multi-copper enzyme maturation permease subunit